MGNSPFYSNASAFETRRVMIVDVAVAQVLHQLPKGIGHGLDKELHRLLTLVATLALERYVVEHAGDMALLEEHHRQQIEQAWRDPAFLQQFMVATTGKLP